MSNMKPLLAENHNPELLKFPYLASPKIDGFRCFVDGDEALTRSRKPQPNGVIFEALSRMGFHGHDGELVHGDVKDPTVFQASSGVLRTKAHPAPDWSWHLFDSFKDTDIPFYRRLERAEANARLANEILGENRVFHVEHTLIETMDDLEKYEAEQLALGFEGVMLRDPMGRYKFGRSTVKENILLKVKRYQHDEAVVVGFVEMMHNENEAFENELGRTARASNAENLVPSGMLGSLICSSPDWPETFDVSASSMTLAERKHYWENREQLRGRLTRYKHFSHGAKDRPRHPVWAGWRDEWDMDPERVKELTKAFNA